MVRFDFVGGSILKNKILINQVNIPLLIVCLSNKNKPTLEVRFLA
jgi:hypothetical protein